MYYVCAPLSWQVPKSHSLPFIMCSGIKHLFQVMFYSWEISISADISLTISTSLPGPGLPAQKLSPAGLGGTVSPCTATLVGQAQALQPLLAAENSAWLWKFNCNIRGVSCNPPLCCCDRNLAASVRRSTLYFAEVQRIFFFTLMSFWSALGFYFRNRTNGSAAPLYCNVYCPAARAHWDWLLFQSEEGEYYYLMGSKSWMFWLQLFPACLTKLPFNSS